jgi:hypothetical protein
MPFLYLRKIACGASAAMTARIDELDIILNGSSCRGFASLQFAEFDFAKVSLGNFRFDKSHISYGSGPSQASLECIMPGMVPDVSQGVYFFYLCYNIQTRSFVRSDSSRNWIGEEEYGRGDVHTETGARQGAG